MKKNIISILIILIVLVVGFFVLRERREKQSDSNINDEIFASSYQSRACYEYNHQATTDEPYTNYEFIDINKNGNDISGIKKGTQSGPDMSNGYEGTLLGTINNDMMNVVFSYVIEGSKQKEKEIYRVEDNSLVKIRYVLTEEDGILVPDLSSEAKEIVYQKTACQSDQEVIDNDWLFSSKTDSDFTFFYPKNFGTNYISPVEWPPKISSVDDSYVCKEEGKEVLEGGETTEFYIGENKYCMNVSSEGAAGTIYTNYSFISSIGTGEMARMDFSIKAVQCGNYDEPKMSECLAEREGFDINKIVDQMFASISKSEK